MQKIFSFQDLRRLSCTRMHSCTILLHLARVTFFLQVSCKIGIFLAIWQVSCKNLARCSYPMTSYKILAKLLLMQDVLQEIHALQDLEVLTRNKFSVLGWSLDWKHSIISASHVQVQFPYSAGLQNFTVFCFLLIGLNSSLLEIIEPEYAPFYNGTKHTSFVFHANTLITVQI